MGLEGEISVFVENTVVFAGWMVESRVMPSFAISAKDGATHRGNRYHVPLFTSMSPFSLRPRILANQLSRTALSGVLPLPALPLAS